MHFLDSVKKVAEITFKRFFNKRILLHGDETAVSANPLELSLFNKTSSSCSVEKATKAAFSALLFTQPKHRNTVASVRGGAGLVEGRVRRGRRRMWTEKGY